jgi:hypothetical protein
MYVFFLQIEIDVDDNYTLNRKACLYGIYKEFCVAEKLALSMLLSREVPVRQA